MRLYADVLDIERPDELLDRVEHALTLSLDPSSPAMSRIEAAREALIAAGMLEQGVADSLGEGEGGHHRQVAPLTECAATILAALAGGRTADPGLPAELAVARSRLLGHAPLTIVHPEGYLFYALFPDLYIQMGAALAAAIGNSPAVVIGVRSIGTSLSAAVAAGLRSRGMAAQRHTVRPVGDPFARSTVPTHRQRDAWRAAARRGAAFIAVDEGPGLSGSSLASVIAALDALGIGPERMHIVCAAPPDSLPMASPQVRAIWRRTPIWPAADLGPDFWQRTMPAWLATPAGVAPGCIADLSWGAWSCHLPDGARPLMPQHERRKLLLDIDGRRVLAKFVGFGPPGRRKARQLSTLAAADLAPPYLGYAHGMVLQEWMRDTSQPLASGDDAILDAAATYFAFLRRSFRVPDAVDVGALARTVGAIAGDWFGPALPGEPRRLLAGMRGTCAMEGDQRPERVEWRVAGDRIRKADAADHYLDHTWARRLDVAFDLAGFAIEFELAAAREADLLRAYATASGDSSIATRIPFFRAVYAAHRLAAADTAYHATGGGSGELDGQRRRMAASLTAALQANGATACA